MHALYGDKKRIVIIDKWNQQKFDSESNGLAKYIESDINPHEMEQWLMMAERNDLGVLSRDFLEGCDEIDVFPERLSAADRRVQGGSSKER